MDPETTRTVITVGGGFVTAFGWVGIGYALTSRATSRQQRFHEGEAEKDRAFREKQRVRELQENAAREFASALNEAAREAPAEHRERANAGKKLATARRETLDAWGAARSVLRDPVIVRANQALDVVLFIAHQDCAEDRDVEQNFYPVGLAFSDLQDAISAFILREKPPQLRLPGPKELEALAYPPGVNIGLEGIRQWAADNGL